MGRVGLVDITVGNAARLGASQRSTTRRCASHHIATQRESRRGRPGGSRAFSADGPPQTLRLARDGTTVAVHYALNELAAHETVAEIKRGGADGFIVGADLRTLDGVKKLFSDLDAELLRRTGSTGVASAVFSRQVGLCQE
jgi:hypothetical protein